MHVRSGGRTASRPRLIEGVRGPAAAGRARAFLLRTPHRIVHCTCAVARRWRRAGVGGPAAFSPRRPDTPWRPRRGPGRQHVPLPCVALLPAVVYSTGSTPLANPAGMQCNAPRPRRPFTWGRDEMMGVDARTAAPHGARDRFLVPATPTRPVSTRVADGDRPITAQTGTDRGTTSVVTCMLLKCSSKRHVSDFPWLDICLLGQWVGFSELGTPSGTERSPCV